MCKTPHALLERCQCLRYSNLEPHVRKYDDVPPNQVKTFLIPNQPRTLLHLPSPQIQHILYVLLQFYDLTQYRLPTVEGKVATKVLNLICDRDQERP